MEGVGKGKYAQLLSEQKTKGENNEAAFGLH